MTNIELKPIDASNWKVCIQLKVAQNQEHLVLPNTYSLLQAAYKPALRPYGIFAEGTMVGFLMFGLEYFQGRDVWSIERLMIDERYQRNGYAYRAMELALALIRADDAPARDIYISYEPGNIAAQNLYLKFGFRNIEAPEDFDEELMHLSLS